MSEIFVKLLNRSITAGWLILAILLIRFLLRKAPKWILCVLWSLVAVRLVCPFSMESTFSLIPATQTVPPDIVTQLSPQVDAGIQTVNGITKSVISHGLSSAPLTSANSLQSILPVLSYTWIVVASAMLLYALISYFRLWTGVRASITIRDNILSCDELHSPFILGIFRPKIYVPSCLKGDSLRFVISHETAHLKRCDHWWKPLGYLFLAIYWFNPLCWIAYILLCRDIELACDEKVIRNLDNCSKASYSQALLDCSFRRGSIVACPLAFGEVGVKERVKSILNYHRPSFRVIVIALILCIATAACFMTNPICSDTITYIRQTASIGNRADFNISFGKKVHSAKITAELWQNGICTASSPLVVNSDTRALTVLFSDRRDGISLLGEDIQIDTNKASGSLITYFPLPEGIRGWSFSSWRDNQRIEIENGKDIILAAINFDFGNGTRSVFNLPEDTGWQAPAYIDCILVIRAEFYEEEISDSLAVPYYKEIAEILDVSFSVDNIIYRCTGLQAPFEPDESEIQYVEIPAGGAISKQISAFAILENGRTAVALYDGKWYKFTAPAGSSQSLALIRPNGFDERIPENCMGYAVLQGDYSDGIILVIQDASIKENRLVLETSQIAVNRNVVVYDDDVHGLSRADKLRENNLPNTAEALGCYCDAYILLDGEIWSWEKAYAGPVDNCHNESFDFDILSLMGRDLLTVQLVCGVVENGIDNGFQQYVLNIVLPLNSTVL